jgi:two-component system, NtrC family, sensor kinase
MFTNNKHTLSPSVKIPAPGTPVTAEPGTAELLRRIDQLEGQDRCWKEAITAHSRLCTLGQLLAGVAHELNNPIGIILGFAQSLHPRLPKDSAIRNPVAAIEREALRCKRLVQDLLSFVRQPKTSKERQEIRDVLEGAMLLVEAQCKVSHVELRREIPKGLPKISLDRHSIQQVLINLCTNAIDAMPRGGKLTISVLPSPNADRPNALILRVTDTGTGIPPQIRDRIFDPFFTTKELGKGTGLGLHLVKQWVQDHDGRLEVASDSGRGSTFSIILPLEKS